ncbi:MAG: RNA polymerase sigma factor [Aestuariibacter sp.]
MAKTVQEEILVENRTDTCGYAIKTLQQQLFALVNRIKNDDEKAFEAFYELTVNRVFGLVFKIIGNKSDTEEIVSEAYIQMWRQRSQYHPDNGSVLGWCLLIARSRALDYYRKTKSFDQLKNNYQVELESLLFQSAEPYEIMQDSGNYKGLMVALNQLGTHQKQAIILSFFRGLSHREIAELLEIPLGTVKSDIKRGMEAIARNLATEVLL